MSLTYTRVLKLILLIATGIVAQGAAQPDWFLKLPVQEGHLVGYGMHKERDLALASARRSIAEQIGVRVQSERELTTHESDGIVDEKFRSRTEERLDVYLESATVIQETREKGIWYVAVDYDNSTLIKRLERALFRYRGANDVQNRYLVKTSLMEALAHELDGRLDVRLSRSKQRWWLTYRETEFPLSQGDLSELLEEVRSPEISLDCSATSPMTEGARFHFRITGKRAGYYSLFNVYTTGAVFVLAANHNLKAGGEWVFPDSASGLEFSAALLNPAQATEDMYVCVYTAEPLNVSRFVPASSSLRHEESTYKFHELIQIMGTEDFASARIRTFPNDFGSSRQR